MKAAGDGDPGTKMAGRLGFEPRSRGSEPRALPLDYLPARYGVPRGVPFGACLMGQDAESERNGSGRSVKGLVRPAAARHEPQRRSLRPGLRRGVAAAVAFLAGAGCAGRPATREALDEGLRWLAARQLPDGSFEDPAGLGDSPVLRVALPLWALGLHLPRGPESDGRVQWLRGASALFRHRRPDGGIYAGGGTTAAFEAHGAREALAAVLERAASDQVESFLGELDAFLDARRRGERKTRAPRALDPSLSTDLPVVELSPGEAQAVRFLRALGGSAATAPAAPTEETARGAALEAPPSILERLDGSSPAVLEAWAALRAQGLGLPMASLRFAECRLLSTADRPALRLFVLARVLAAAEAAGAGGAAAERAQLKELRRQIAARVLEARRGDGAWPAGGSASDAPGLLDTAFAVLALGMSE